MISNEPDGPAHLETRKAGAFHKRKELIMPKLITMLRSVTFHLRRARDFISSGAKMAATAAATLDPVLGGYLREGEELNGIRPVQLALVRWVEDDRQQLTELEEGHRAAQRELAKLRQRRDGDANVLYSQMLRVRQTFDDAFGPGTAPVYLGLDPGMGAVEPLVLQRYAGASVTILRDPELSTPPPLVEGLWENPQIYAQQIETSLTALTASLDAIDDQKREAEVALVARDALLVEAKTRLKWSIRLVEAIYHLAGLGAHAERLRTTFATRPSEDEPDDDFEPVPSGETDASETGVAESSA